jgi:ABC-type nickel/cobalt efflux system permease component RcnA
MPRAILLGVLLDLEPCHSKTMMAAFFIIVIHGTLARAPMSAVMLTAMILVLQYFH